MLTGCPSAIPEIPVSDFRKAIQYYVDVLGFQLDWIEEDGIGGISQGDCRMFLTSTAFRQHYGTAGPTMVWLNVGSKAEVDELYQRWNQTGGMIVAEPKDQPWLLREFRVEDLDGNQFRVFYDFSREQD